MLMRAVTNIANGKPPSFLVLTLIATITGFSISLLLSVVYGKLIRKRPLVTWGATAVVLALAVGVAAFIEGWTIWLWQGGGDGNFASLVLGVFYIEMTLLGAWSALYYAMAAGNLFIAWRYGLKEWAPDNAFVPTVGPLVLFVIQYVTMRSVIRRTIMAKVAAGTMTAPAE